MNEEIIKMAREAGAMFEELPLMDGIVFSVDDREWNSQALERFFHMAQAAEREACAKVCGELHLSGDDDCGQAADAIRARGQA